MGSLGGELEIGESGRGLLDLYLIVGLPMYAAEGDRLGNVLHIYIYTLDPPDFIGRCACFR